MAPVQSLGLVVFGSYEPTAGRRWSLGPLWLPVLSTRSAAPSRSFVPNKACLVSLTLDTFGLGHLVPSGFRLWFLWIFHQFRWHQALASPSLFGTCGFHLTGRQDRQFQFLRTSTAGLLWFLKTAAAPGVFLSSPSPLPVSVPSGAE